MEFGRAALRFCSARGDEALGHGAPAVPTESHSGLLRVPLTVSQGPACCAPTGASVLAALPPGSSLLKQLCFSGPSGASRTCIKAQFWGDYACSRPLYQTFPFFSSAYLQLLPSRPGCCAQHLTEPGRFRGLLSLSASIAAASSSLLNLRKKRTECYVPAATERVLPCRGRSFPCEATGRGPTTAVNQDRVGAGLGQPPTDVPHCRDASQVRCDLVPQPALQGDGPL